MKKIISLLTALALILGLSFTVFAEEKTLSKKADWIITPSSSYATGDISAAFDGNGGSYWHSDYYFDGKSITWKAEAPHAVNIIFPSATNVSGLKYLPRQDDNETGIWQEIKVFGTKNGEEYTQLYEGTMKVDKTEKYVSWGDVSLKAIQIEITKSNGGFCTAAEIKLLTGGTGSVINNGAKMQVEPPYIAPEKTNGTVIERDKTWVVTATSNDANNQIVNAFDGSESSYWHTAYQTNEDNTAIISNDQPPHIITVDFGQEMEVSGFTVVPRASGDTGKFKAFNIYSSKDGENFTKIAEGNFAVTPGVFKPKSFSWGNTKMRAIKIEVTDSVGGYGTAAEIYFLKDSVPEDRVFDTSSWKITAKSQQRENSQMSWGTIGAILDGNPDSFWHSYYYAEGANITEMDSGPYYIDITLPKEDTIQGFSYTPRQGDDHGRLLEYNVKVSDSDTGEFTTIYKGEEAASMSATKTIDFGVAVTVKRIQLEILRTSGSMGSIADFIFKPGQKDVKVVKPEEFNDAIYTTYLNEIDKTNFQLKANIKEFNTKYKLSNIFDGSSNAWQSELATAPVTLEINLGGKHIIQAVKIQPLLSSGYIGYWDKIDMLISDDGTHYTEVLKDYSFPERNLDEKTITLDKEIRTKYVAFRINKYTNNRVACGEITFLQTLEQRDREAGRDEKYTLVIDSPSIKVEKEGQGYDRAIDAAPYITSVGSTLIPLRGLLEEMGATVTWSDEDQTIVIDNGTKKITMQVGSKLVYIENSGITVRYTMTAPPKIKNSRTYIPVRFVSEHLGYNVAWDGETKTITIN